MITYERAKQLTGDRIKCPVAGDNIAEAAASAGEYELAAAAQLIGSMCCLGHNRADRMKDAAEFYWQKFTSEKAATAKRARRPLKMYRVPLRRTVTKNARYKAIIQPFRCNCLIYVAGRTHAEAYHNLCMQFMPDDDRKIGCKSSIGDWTEEKCAAYFQSQERERQKAGQP